VILANYESLVEEKNMLDLANERSKGPLCGCPREMEGWCLFSVFKMSFSTILKRCHLLCIATIPVWVRSWDEQEGVVRERPNTEARR
jgi:hypothetical protein